MVKKQRPAVRRHGKNQIKPDPLNLRFTQVWISLAIGTHGGL